MDSIISNRNLDSLFAEIDRYNDLPDRNESISEFLTRIKNSKNLSNKNISDRTGLSEPTVSRYLKGTAKRMTQRYILALIMGLELTSPQIEAALRLSGVRIDNPSLPENRIIMYCLDRCSLTGSDKMTVADCNQLLQARHCEPLTGEGVDECSEAE